MNQGWIKDGRKVVKVPDFVDDDDPEAAAPKARLAPSTVFNKIR